MPLASDAYLIKKQRLEAARKLQIPLKRLPNQKALEEKAKVKMAIDSKAHGPVRLQPISQVIAVASEPDSQQEHDAEVSKYNQWRNKRINACYANLKSYMAWLELCDAQLKDPKNKGRLQKDKQSVLLGVAEIYEELGCFGRTLRRNDLALTYYQAALKIYPQVMLFGSPAEIHKKKQHITFRIEADSKEVEEISKELKLK